MKTIVVLFFALTSLVLNAQNHSIKVNKPVDAVVGGNASDTSNLTTDYVVDFFAPSNSGETFTLEVLVDADSISGAPNLSVTLKNSLDGVTWTTNQTLAANPVGDTAFYMTLDTLTRPYNRLTIDNVTSAQKTKNKIFYSIKKLK